MTSSTKLEVHLDWKGPFKWDSLDPKPLPGLYLWVAGPGSPYTLSYVGESDNVRIRMRNHIIQLLGGGYWLWDIEKLRNSDLGEGLYEPDKDADEFFSSGKYLAKLQEYLDHARDNLKEYSFFCAYDEDGKLRDSNTRKSVESALLHNSELYIGYKGNLKIERCLQNSQVSRTGPTVRVKSKFKPGIKIKGITKGKWVNGIA